jgi:hypothetical protein
LNSSSFKTRDRILFYRDEHAGNIAKELETITCTLSHRFLRQLPNRSLPENGAAEDYALLTMETVIIDSVKFIEWVRDMGSRVKDSQVIVVGHSYGERWTG